MPVTVTIVHNVHKVDAGSVVVAGAEVLACAAPAGNSSRTAKVPVRNGRWFRGAPNRNCVGGKFFSFYEGSSAARLSP